MQVLKTVKLKLFRPADLNAAINIAKRFKNSVSGYMPDALGDVTTPLTPATKKNFNKIISVFDRRSPHL